MSRYGDYERLPMYAYPESNKPRLRSSSSRSFLNTPSSPTRPLQSPPIRVSRSRGGFFSRNKQRITHLVRPITILKYAIPTVIILVLLGFFLYEPHVELAFYSRGWVKEEIEKVLPLSDCFDPSKVASTHYNLTEGLYGARQFEVQAGLPLRHGMDCYDFAGTIRSTNKTPHHGPRTEYHTYWRVDLVSFGPRQEWMLKSFFATQDMERTRLVLWSNGDLSHNEILRGYLAQYPDAFALKIVDIRTLAKGTKLEGSPLLKSEDKKAWVDGDLIRLLLLWNFGGVWVDMDSLLTRDLDPLLEHEFVTQWDCYDKLYRPFNGALMRFKQHSPYLCEAFHIMSISKPPRPDSTDWGALLYFKLWRSLVAASLPPFKILPFCFSDGRSCRLDNRLPDPFDSDSRSGWDRGKHENLKGMQEGEGLDTIISKIFGIHLHNQWEKEYPKDGWVQRLLLDRFDKKLGHH